MKTKNALILSALATTLASCGAQQDEQPNIVWLIAEDFSPDLGCYGHPLVHSPNLDKLAAEGIRYEYAFASSPVCSAARSGFITGMYQNALAADEHDTMEKNKLPLPAGVKTLPDYFHDAGYFVSFNGKTHFNFKYEGEGIKARDIEERAEGQPFFLVLQTNSTHRRRGGSFLRDSIRPVDPAAVELPVCYPDLPDLVEMIASKRKGIDRWNASHGLPENPSDEEVLEAWHRFLFDDGYRQAYIQ